MAKDKDGKKLKLENNRFHVVKTCQTVAGTLRDAAELIDAFGKQLATFPLSGFADTTNFDLPTLTLGVKSDEDGDDGTGKKKRKRVDGKEKKLKDPNAPKRPPSAYLLYQNDVRQTMKELHKDRPYREVLGEISKSWAKMTDADKKVYVEATDLAKQLYTEKKAEYDKTLGPPPKEEEDKDDESAPKAAESPAKVTESGVSDEEELSEEQQDSEEGSDEEMSEESEKEPPKKKKKGAAVVEEEEPPKKKQKKTVPASEDESPKSKAKATPAKDRRKRKD